MEITIVMLLLKDEPWAISNVSLSLFTEDFMKERSDDPPQERDQIYNT